MSSGHSPANTRPHPFRAVLSGRSRRIAITLIVALGLGAATVLWSRGNSKSALVTRAPQPTVLVAPVVKEDLPIVVQALGTVTPLSTVTVKSQITGYLISVAFTEGQRIRKGDLLAQIDSRPYQATLSQSQGQLIRDQALLKNAQLDLARYQRLLSQDSTSHQLVDTAAATVSQYQGAVQSDRALIKAQKLNIEYCRITSPIDGRLGLRQIDAGNFVQASDTTGLVVISQMRPISVMFILPQAQLGPILKRFNAGAVLPVTAYDGADAAILDEGTLRTIDNQIDTSTGTVKLRAVFGNQDDAMFPNQFVNVRILVETLAGALTVPSAAVQHGPSATYVYTVNSGGIVAARTVVTGAEYQDRTVVHSGLSVDDRVVVDGVNRLTDGTKVSIAQRASPTP
jgi:multidrug efflux system membrane fusion protein